VRWSRRRWPPPPAGGRSGGGRRGAERGGLVGLLFAPATGTYLWFVLFGLGQGAALSLAMLFIVQRSPDTRHAAQLSSMAQCFGYLLASVARPPWARRTTSAAAGPHPWPPAGRPGAAVAVRDHRRQDRQVAGHDLTPTATTTPTARESGLSAH